MKKKHCIGWLLAGAVAMLLITHSAAAAADKVVVIPLGRDTGGVSTVTSGGGLVWMDRNLGALGVATKSDDPDAYGSLYQWGRLGDGHEYRESPTTGIPSLDDVPGHGNFIVPVGGSPWDWMNTQNDDLWKGESGINNPCPAGFRLPTETEWVIEKYFWGSNNAAGAFASPLKLVVAGYRWIGGSIHNAGSVGYYWSSTDYGYRSRHLTFHSGNANMTYYDRAGGMSVRCLKD